MVLNVATSRSHPQNGFYGAAIGGVVLAAAYMFRALNPADA